MSTSSRSKLHDPLRLERRHRIAGIAAGLAVTLTIIWTTAARPDAPELRIVATGDMPSVEIVSGRHVILIANSTSPTEARAGLGILNRPWEPQPTVIITGSDDSLANGLWETLQRTRAEQLIVLGAPGDSQDWTRIERYCRDAGIEVRFLERQIALELEALTLTLVPGESSSRGFQDSHAIVSNEAMRIAIEIGGLPPAGRFHVLVAEDTDTETRSADLVITTSARMDLNNPTTRLRVDQGRRVVLAVEPTKLKVQGGVLDSKPGN